MEMVEPRMVEPSSVKGVELIGPGAVEFGEALESILGRTPDDVLKPALPYSVIARNKDARAIALLGIRFDMVGRQAKPYSVIHYADMLRHPEKADLKPGAMRFVCAEPLYTDLVLRREREVDQRGRMNLENLRTVLRINASLDCVGFDDGQFAGPDSLGAFDRFERERDAEIALIAEIGKPEDAIETLQRAMEIPVEQARDRALIARRVLARRLHESYEAGGLDEMIARARSHRVRIKLWR
jgi:hypothetical protein